MGSAVKSFLALMLAVGLCQPPILANEALRTECLGQAQGAKGYLVYLHGFEPLPGASGEEKENRQALEKLASSHSLRIALPQGPVCPGKKRCWPARDAKEVEASFQSIKLSLGTCFPKDVPYTLLGFSNGGYAAFKFYKFHKDPRLTRIIASSSSGIWNPEKDKVNPLSTFHLMIGDKDITRKDAAKFAALFKQSVPNFELLVFPGGHRLDFETLSRLIPR